MIIKVDALGDVCPVPVVKAKNALKQLANGGTVEISVDNSIAVQNLEKMAKQKNIRCTSEKLNDAHYIVSLTVEGSGKAEEKPEEETECNKNSVSFGMVVVFSSNEMGEGNSELGCVLMKSFIYALKSLDMLPSAILCYNSGVMLTTEGSDSIEDLKSLEAQGVEVLSCGTCLDFYGLKDRLAVGSVTNMYAIAEKLSQAVKIIKP